MHFTSRGNTASWHSKPLGIIAHGLEEVNGVGNIFLYASDNNLVDSLATIGKREESCSRGIQHKLGKFVSGGLEHS